jgi:hypothetical protein
MFKFIEIWHNIKIRHSSLDNKPIEEFRNQKKLKCYLTNSVVLFVCPINLLSFLKQNHQENIFDHQ